MSALRRLFPLLVLVTLPACGHVAGQVCSGMVGHLVEGVIVDAVELAVNSEPYTPPTYVPVYTPPAGPPQEVLTGGRASAPSTPGGIPAEQELRAARQRQARRERTWREQSSGERQAIARRAEQQLSTLRP